MDPLFAFDYDDIGKHRRNQQPSTSSNNQSFTSQDLSSDDEHFQGHAMLSKATIAASPMATMTEQPGEDSDYEVDEEAYDVIRRTRRSSRSSRSSGASRTKLNLTLSTGELTMTAMTSSPTQTADGSLKLESSIEHYGTPREIIVPIGDVDFVTDRLASPGAAMTSAGTLDHNFSLVALSMANAPQALHKVGKRDFELLKVIGKGAYGKVFLVRKNVGKDSGTLYAMKVLEKAHIVLHAKDTEHTKNERTILEEVRHPFIVKLFYAFQTDAKLYLILDYACGGELFTYLEKEKMLLEDKAVFYMAELTLALEHLHRLGIIYRDLKPENVLLDREGHVLLTDFGLSKVAVGHGDRANTVCGTIEYMAPEVVANTAYDMSVDWWSLGALSYDIMTGAPPFTGNNRKVTMDRILNKKLTLPYYLSPDAKDLLTKLMKKKPTVRLGYGPDDAKSVKGHRFFRKIDWISLYNRGYPPPIVPSIVCHVCTNLVLHERTLIEITGRCFQLPCGIHVDACCRFTAHQFVV